MYTPIPKYTQRDYPSGNITQWFGGNYDLYSRFGLNGHSGIDIVDAYGTDLLAVEDGIVVEVNNNPDGYGKHVRFISDRASGNKHREWTYGHCSEITVKKGQKVQGGEKIGEMGNTGFVVSGATPFWKFNPYAGTHLHLGVREVTLGKGWSYPGSKIKLSVVNYNNGFKGSINPAPYFLNNAKQLKHAQILTLLSLAKTLRALLIKAQSRL